MGKIRVLHVLGGLNAGGMESMIMNYYRNIDRNKIQFDFLVFSQRSYYDDEVEKLGGRIFRITPIRKGIIRNFLDVEKFFKKHHREYRIIHIHQGILNLSILKKSRRYNIPVRIAHSHGVNRNLLKRLKLYNKYYAKPEISKLATEYFSCSTNTLDHLFTEDIIKSEKYTIMTNAIDTELFSYNEETRNRIRSKLGLGNKIVVGHVGTFLPVKNHEFIIDIFHAMHNLNPETILLLIGTGPLEEVIKEKAKKLKIYNNVVFLGQRNDINELLQGMDALLLPSHFEGLPVIGVEAQSSGLNCFITDNITKEIKLTNLIRFINLNKPASYWADQIYEVPKGNRLSANLTVKKKGYDVKDQAIWLEQFYLNKYKNG